MISADAEQVRRVGDERPGLVDERGQQQRERPGDERRCPVSRPMSAPSAPGTPSGASRSALTDIGRLMMIVSIVTRMREASCWATSPAAISDAPSRMAP